MQESRELGENASSALGIWTWFIGPIVGLNGLSSTTSIRVMTPMRVSRLLLTSSPKPDYVDGLLRKYGVMK